MLGVILVRGREILSQSRELLTRDGIHLPQVIVQHLMQAGALGGAAHVRVELTGRGDRRLELDDQRLGTRGANIGHGLSGSERRAHGEHHCQRQDQRQSLAHIDLTPSKNLYNLPSDRSSDSCIHGSMNYWKYMGFSHNLQVIYLSFAQNQL